MTFRPAGSGWMVGAACALVLTGAGTALLGCTKEAPAVAASSGVGGMGSATSSVATGGGGMGGGGMPPMLSFATPVSYDVGGARSVTAGDWNGDGKLDLAVANFESANVSILLGNGNGTFQAKVDYATGQYPTSVTAGDWNGDGKLDLAVANGDSNVSILLNTSQ